MKILKILVIAIIGLVAVVCILGLFAPKEFNVEREITINKPKTQVFEYLKSLKNQNEWSVWAKKDPNMKKDFTGTDGTVGFVSSWDSENSEVGKGEQEIKGITEGARLDMELRFVKPRTSTMTAYFTTEEITENQTKVKWGFSGGMPFPMNAMMLVMNMDKMVGKDFEQGLANLKAILEK